MKYYFAIIILVHISLFSGAQNSNTSDCATVHTGSIIVKNSTKGDIYFYYDIGGNGGVNFTKIKYSSSATIDLPVGTFDYRGLHAVFTYFWKATYQISENAFTTYDVRNPISSGNVIVPECKSKTIEIFD